MLKRIMLYVVALCMMIPLTVCAQGQSSARIEVFTDRSRLIVFEQLNGSERIVLPVDKQGVQEFVYSEPGTYQYQVYEDRNADDRDATEYIVTVFISVDEVTGAFLEPVVSVDCADGSGKPSKIRFKTSMEPVTPEPPKPSTPPEESSTEKYSETHETYEPKEETKKKKKKKTIGTTSENHDSNSGSRKNSRTSFIDTGDTSVILLYFGLFVLALAGFVFIIRRKRNQHKK